MMLSAVLLLLGMSAGDAPAPDRDNPLAWGIAEWWHCHQPDTVNKSCMSIAKYAKLEGDRYRNEALTVVPYIPGIVMQTSMTVTVLGRSVCGTILPTHVRNAVLWRQGVRVQPAQAAPMIKLIVAATAPVFGKEICTLYKPDGAELTAEVAIDGVRMAELDQRVKWIHRGDTYSVQP